MERKIDYLTQVKHNLDALGFNIDHRTNCWTKNGMQYRDIDMVATEIINYRIANNLPATAFDHLIRNLKLSLHLEKEIVKKELCKTLSYDSSLQSNLTEYTRLIIGDNQTNEEYEMVELVIANILYTVKRRLYDKIANTPLLVNFFGDEGSGKNRALRKLFSIFPEDRLKETKDGNTYFNDERWIQSFEDNYVIIFNELGGMKKADIEKVKSLIDQTTIAHRPMRTNTIINVINNAQLIGTSNVRLNETLLADNSLRKFAEIDFYTLPTEPERQARWDKIDYFDYMTLWKSINENDDISPIEKRRDEFKLWTNRKCVRHTDTNIWYNILLEKYEGKNITMDTIYGEYTSYCDKHSIQSEYRKGKTTLKNHITHYGGCTDVRTNKARYIHIPLKKDCKLYFNDGDSMEDCNAPQN